MKSDELQRAIYAALSGAPSLDGVVVSITADMEQPGLPEDDSAYPCITIGNDSAVTWDSHTFTGASHSCQIDVWSRQRNFLEVKTIAGLIRGILHRQDLTIAGADHVLTVNESAVFTRDPDGITKRALCMYRIVLTET